MRIAILDYKKKDCIQILNQIEHFGEEFGVNIEASIFTNGITLLSNYQHVWDLIFLNPELPFIDGLSLAKKIREIDCDVILVLMSETIHFAADGYQAAVFDYFVKPISYQQLCSKLLRVQQLIQNKDTDSIIVKKRGFSKKLKLNDILCIEISNHTMIYHTVNQDISATSSLTLKSLETSLAPKGFLRCSNAFLVNLRYIDSIDNKSVTLVNGTQLKFTEKYGKDFRQAVHNYYNS